MRAAILALGLLVVGGNRVTTIGYDSGAELVGETVTVSYVADPAMGHGQFRLHNHGATAATASVASAWLELGGDRRPLADITVFDLEQEQMVNPDNFKVDGTKTLGFLLGFPRVAHEPRFGESSAVGLRLRVDGAELQALSPIKFVRRVPRGL